MIFMQHKRKRILAIRGVNEIVRKSRVLLGNVTRRVSYRYFTERAPRSCLFSLNARINDPLFFPSFSLVISLPAKQILHPERNNEESCSISAIAILLIGQMTSARLTCR